MSEHIEDKELELNDHTHGHDHCENHAHHHEHEHREEHDEHHAHGHHHHHHHDHSHVITSLNRAFIIGITLNIVYVLAEAIAGFGFHSLGLLSDAGHNLSDVVSLVLALIAFKLSDSLATRKFTYGYKKSTILISLLNALILGVAVVLIVVESVRKIIHPEPIQGEVISIVAAIGVVINGITAWLFMKDQKRDLNVKGAYLHMLADTLVSIGVVVSGILIYFTGWYIVDPIIGLVVAVVIIFASWELLRDSIRLSLDGVPMHVNYDQVVSLLGQADGVKGVHHLHIWAISTTENALTAHILVDELDKMEEIKEYLKHELKEHGISHATLEFETPQSKCTGKCHE
ncbi:MAG: cation transporter [Bacteroidales bacterium]|nr:cation transporter [Bacteroidales bacterium]